MSDVDRSARLGQRPGDARGRLALRLWGIVQNKPAPHRESTMRMSLPASRSWYRRRARCQARRRSFANPPAAPRHSGH